MSKRQGIAIVAMLALLAVLVGVVLHLHSGRAANQFQNAELDRKSHNPTTRGPLKRPASDPAATVENSEEIQTPKQQPDQPAARNFTLSIRIVDPKGAPIAGLAVQVGDGPLWDRRPGWEEEPILSTVTDADGSFDLPLRNPRWVYIQTVEEGWHLQASFEAKPGMSPVLTAFAVVTLYFSVQVDTGEPWFGRAYVSGAAEERRLYLEVIEGEVAKLERVPVDDLNILFLEYMMGVDEQKRTVPEAEVRDGATITIVLKSNPKNQTGHIEVDVTGYVGEIKELQVLIGPGGPAGGALTYTQYGEYFRTEQVWRSRPLAPKEFTVRIIGKTENDPIWTSDLIKVEPRKITRVTVTMHAVCTLEVSIMDEQSAPIPNAVFMLGKDTLPAFQFLQPTPGSIAFAEKNGTAKLSGIRPGKQTFTVAADGYEPQVLELELADGEYRVLDAVYLVKAMGSIKVTLTGREDKLKYSVMIVKPGGLALRTARDLKTDSTSFTDLPMNEFMVMAIVGSGGKPVYARVTLSADEPEASITLDVSGLTEKPLDDSSK